MEGLGISSEERKHLILLAQKTDKFGVKTICLQCGRRGGEVELVSVPKLMLLVEGIELSNVCRCFVLHQVLAVDRLQFRQERFKVVPVCRLKHGAVLLVVLEQ